MNTRFKNMTCVLKSLKSLKGKYKCKKSQKNRQMKICRDVIMNLATSIEVLEKFCSQLSLFILLNGKISHRTIAK